MRSLLLLLFLLLLATAGCHDWDYLGRNYGPDSCIGCVEDGPYNYAFVTSETYVPGALGGLDGADAVCQGLADAADLHGTFRAWLSTSTVDAQARLGTARGWIRPDGRPFTDSVSALTGPGQIFFPLRLDEMGHDIVDEGLFIQVATGTSRTGLRRLDTSNDWTSSSTRYFYGDPMATTRLWTEKDVSEGQRPAHLYCFGVDHEHPLTIARPSGRTAFLSHGSFSPSGLVNADAQCQNEATDAGLSGTYRALLSTLSSGATARFDLTGPTWLRLDGVPWLEQASDLEAGTVFTALNLKSDGSYGDYSVVWTGSASPGIASTTAGQDCGEWSATGQNGIVGVAEYSDSYFFDISSGNTCGLSRLLYCLQE